MSGRDRHSEDDLRAVALPVRRRRPLSHYQLTGQRVWPVLADYRAAPISPRVADALRSCRCGRGLRQRDLAELLEVTPPYISLLEHARRAPSVKVADRLAEVLGLPGDIALQLRAESVLPRPAAAYVKPWRRGRDYRPQVGRQLGFEKAASPTLRDRTWENTQKDQVLVVEYVGPSFANWRR